MSNFIIFNKDGYKEGIWYIVSNWTIVDLFIKKNLVIGSTVIIN